LEKVRDWSIGFDTGLQPGAGYNGSRMGPWHPSKFLFFLFFLYILVLHPLGFKKLVKSDNSLFTASLNAYTLHYPLFSGVQYIVPFSSLSVSFPPHGSVDRARRGITTPNRYVFEV
jgi:hypothetical protein